jgi:hypothetical protein
VKNILRDDKIFNNLTFKNVQLSDVVESDLRELIEKIEISSKKDHTRKRKFKM